MTTRRQGDHTPWQPPLRPPSHGLRVALGEPPPAVTNAGRDRQQVHHAALAYQRRAKELGQDLSYRDAVLAASGGVPEAKPDPDRGQLAAAASRYQAQQAQLGRKVSIRDALLEVTRELSHR